MAQHPLKKVKVLRKPSKYRKASRKNKDENSCIRRHVNKKTIALLTQRYAQLEDKKR